MTRLKITAGTLTYSMLHSGYPVEPGPRFRIPYSLYVDLCQKDPSNHEITVTNLGLGTSKSRATLRSKHTYTPGSLRYRARARCSAAYVLYSFDKRTRHWIMLDTFDGESGHDPAVRLVYMSRDLWDDWPAMNHVLENPEDSSLPTIL